MYTINCFGPAAAAAAPDPDPTNKKNNIQQIDSNLRYRKQSNIQ